MENLRQTLDKEEYIKKVRETAIAYVLEYGYTKAMYVSEKDILIEHDDDFSFNVFQETIGLSYEKDLVLGRINEPPHNYMKYAEDERNGMAWFLKD